MKRKYPEVDFSLISTTTRTYGNMPVEFRLYKAFNKEGNYRVGDWVTYKIPEFPELYLGSNQPGNKPFPTKESDYKEFDIGFGKRVHDLAGGSLTEEQSRIAQALEKETGYAEIAIKRYQEAVAANEESAYRQNSPISEAGKSNREEPPRLSTRYFIQHVASKLLKRKAKE